MESMRLWAAATATEGELFWTRPSGPSCDYEVFLNGNRVGTSAATHFTVEGLQPETQYSAEVRTGKTAMQVLFETSPVRQRLDVTKAPYFAKGDGKTQNTAALQRAFEDCGADQEVYFPAGVYRTGALDLHSNMAIYLEENAVLQGSDRPEDYLPRIHSRFEGVERECYRSLLNAGTLDHKDGANCTNILIYGKGTICGGGRILAERTIESERLRLKDYLAANAALVATCENDRTIPGRVRGRLINLSNCAHVRISGLTLQDGASWNVHMVYSRDIITDHCTLRSAGIWNGDGWDPDSSENCMLFASTFFTEDDSVAIKSGKNPEGNQIDRPTRHVYVFDCKSMGGHGICIGSEMSGGVEDVRIWDCDISRSSNGMEIKGTPKRGGYVRNVRVQNSSFPRLLIHAVPYNDDGIPAPQPPYFEDFSFENMHLTGRRLEHGEMETVPPIEIAGFSATGHEVRGVRLKDCILPREAEVKFSRCRMMTLENLQTEE